MLYSQLGEMETLLQLHLGFPCHDERSSFEEQPIPDRQVIDDEVVVALVLRLVRRLRKGEVIYVHCKGGHVIRQRKRAGHGRICDVCDQAMKDKYVVWCRLCD